MHNQVLSGRVTLTAGCIGCNMQWMSGRLAVFEDHDLRPERETPDPEVP